jgi:hypothetical protein
MNENDCVSRLNTINLVGAEEETKRIFSWAGATAAPHIARLAIIIGRQAVQTPEDSLIPRSVDREYQNISPCGARQHSPLVSRRF